MNEHIPATKENCEELIDRLADKTLSLGCRVECPITKIHRIYLEVTSSGGARLASLSNADTCVTAVEFSDFKIIGHPVVIGDVLEKMKNDNGEHWLVVTHQPRVDLVFLWGECGLSKSFQTIIEESGWEEIKTGHSREVDHDGNLTTWYVEDQLKDKNARALAEFLLTIFKK